MMDEKSTKLRRETKLGLAGGLAGCWLGWPAGRLAGCWLGSAWLVGWAARAGLLAGWLVGWLAGF